MSDTNLADPPVDEAPIAGDSPPDTPSAPAEAPSEPVHTPLMVPMDIMVREVTPLRARNRELESALDEHRRQLAEARGLLERFQRQPAGDDQNRAPAPAQRPTESSYSQQDIDRRAAELNFRQDASAVSEFGVKTYGKDRWDDLVNILGSFNLNNADFVQSIMDIAGRDNAHEIIHDLGQNPRMVAALSNMSPNRRIAEIARMSSKPAAASATSVPVVPAAPPAKTVSKAPAPAPRVDASAGQVVDWRSDKASDDEFSKGWNDRYMRRGDAIRR